jgi:CheY-like chemotaxis protein
MAKENKLDPQTLREHIGKHLRTADEYAHNQRYDDAIAEIDSALKLDPKNNYARSFLERVKLMQKRYQEKESVQNTSAELSFEERTELISRHLSSAEEFINKKDYPRALEAVASAYKIDPSNYYAQTYSERIDALMMEAAAEKNTAAKTNEQPEPENQAVAKAEMQPEPVKTPQPPSPQRGSTLMYRELLKEAWFDGRITDEEGKELVAMRELFGITLETHILLEHEVKIEAYLEALVIAGHDNIISDMEQKTLAMMRTKYGISQEEQTVAESRYNEIKRTSKSRGTILIVDTDQQTLESLSKALKQRGFTNLLAQNVEGAIQILLKQVPNIILSEIFFKNSQIDGIAFFKKLQEHPSLKKVPFIFISSLTDKKIIEAGLRLGIDYFITKPIDYDMLFAVIDGRLRV